MAVTSLTRREHGETVAFWTLANYRTFFTEGSGVFVAALWNSIEVTLIVTVAGAEEQTPSLTVKVNESGPL